MRTHNGNRIIEVDELRTSIVWDTMDMAHHTKIGRLASDRPTPFSEARDPNLFCTRNGNIITRVHR